jgi:plastocyanin
MSNETLFYVLGSCLVVSALVLAFSGLRNASFPPRAALIGLTTLFAALVLATAAVAVLNAQDEQDKRNAELASEEQGAAAEQGGGTAEAGAAVLDVTSPDDGSLVYEPDGLEAPAGDVTLSYENPSAVPHSIAIELDGKQLAATDTVTDGDKAELTQKLAPGEYVFYCTVPGHRQAGMEGDLTVTGPQKP